jgi:hypothetical protein
MHVNRKNVPGVPNKRVSDKNDYATRRFEIQFAVAAIPPHIPLNCAG